MLILKSPQFDAARRRDGALMVCVLVDNPSGISPRNASLVLRQASDGLYGVIRDDAAGHSTSMIALPPIKPEIARWISDIPPFTKASVRSRGDHRIPGDRYVAIAEVVGEEVVASYDAKVVRPRI